MSICKFHIFLSWSKGTIFVQQVRCAAYNCGLYLVRTRVYGNAQVSIRATLWDFSSTRSLDTQLFRVFFAVLLADEYCASSDVLG